MKKRILTSSVFWSVVVCLTLAISVSAQQDSALPETGKVRAISVAYSQSGQLSRFMFIGENNKSHHWLEVWKVKNTDDPNVVNYIVEPRTVVTWGRGPVLTDVFAPQCFPSSVPQFGPKDYWVAVIKGNKLTFQILDQEEDQRIVKGIFANLQGASTQSRAGGLLDMSRHTSVWEANVMSRFQKGKRDWIKPEWVQSLTVCIKVFS
jgi:hypothetical protein